MTKTYYTDGSSRGNPGPGGWGYVRLEGDKIFDYDHGRELKTTNNRMELMAILKVAEIAAENPSDEFIIYTDSLYCVNSINKWMRGWASNNWVRPNKQPVENLELMQALYKLFSRDFFNATVRKIPGHVNILGNELADRLATNHMIEFDGLLEVNSIKPGKDKPKHPVEIWNF